jgi:Regulator of chromosome condensation (RCC1) repeat/Leucine Rich repeats (2 copies)
MEGAWVLGVVALATLTACGRADSPDAPGPTRVDGGDGGAVAAGCQSPASDPFGQQKVLGVSVGGGSACALTANGAVFCWGSSAVASSALPAIIPGLESGVTAVSAGTDSACAITGSGAVQCWGVELGSEPPWAPSISAVPVPIQGLTSGATAVSVGDKSACAIAGSGGVQCWGDNEYGQLGNGSAAQGSPLPVPVMGLESGVTAVSVAGGSACAVTAGGAVDCWGDNSYGLLGSDPTALPFSAVPVPVQGLTSGATAVSLGGGAACALTANGQVTCWGATQALDAFSPGPLRPGPIAGLSSGVTAVAVASSDGCALTAGGGVACWGDTLSVGNVYPPLTVAGLESGVTAVSVGLDAAGDDLACAVTGDGGVACWGSGSSLPRPVWRACAPDSLDAGGDSADAGDSSPAGCADPLRFADPYVEVNVGTIGAPSGPIHPADVVGLTDLYIPVPPNTPVDPPPGYVGPIASLTGVECLWNLRRISFEAYFVDLTPLSRLPNLTVLDLLEARETDVPRLPHVTEFRGDLHSNTAAFLEALPSLRVLEPVGADVSTAEARAALSALTGLTTLSLPGAGLTDTAPLGAMSLLTDVDLDSNQIQDISSLSSLANLRSLDLTGNQVTDLSPLVANVSLGYGTAIAIGSNPIDCTAQAQNIATLRARGVTLTADCP